MYAPHRTAAIGLTLTLAFAACDNGTSTSDDALGDLDPAAARSATAALVTPLNDSESAIDALRDAFGDLTDQGISFMRAPGPDLRAATGLITGAALVNALQGGAADLVFPTGLQGATFVYDLESGQWAADSTRTGAPPGGVRVVWYATEGSGALVQPLSEEGYIDLTDEDTGGALSRIGIRIVETTDTGDVVLADLDESLVTGLAAQQTETFEATGFYGGSSGAVDVDILSDAVADTVTGDQEFTLSIALASDASAYDLTITGSEDGESGEIQQNWVGTLIRDGVVTELDLDLSEAGGTQSGSGTLSYDGTALVEITVQGSDFTYRGLQGGLSSRAEAGVDDLVRTLFLAGLEVFLAMPGLFLL